MRTVIVKSQSFGPALACLAALLIFAFSALVDQDSLEGTYSFLRYLPVLALFVALLGADGIWFARLFPGDPVILHPPVLFTGWSLVMIALPGGYHFFDNAIMMDKLTLYGVRGDCLVPGMMLLLFGCLCVSVGYGLTVRFFSAGSVGWRLAARTLAFDRVLVLAMLTIGVQLLRIMVVGASYGSDTSRWGAFGFIDGIVGYTDVITSLMISLLAIKAIRGEWSPRPLWGFVAVQMFFAMISGGSTPMVRVVLALLMSGAVMNMRMRKYAVWLLGIVPLIIFVVPISQGIRLSAEANTKSRDLSEAVGSAVWAYDQTWARGASVGWGIFTEKFFGREAEVAFMPGVIMAKTPSQIPHEGYQQFFMVPVLLIPRAVWPNKPIVSRGVDFSIQYLNMPLNTRTSSAPTVFGEGYMFAGWAGAAAVGLIFGVAFAWHYQNSTRVGIPALSVAMLSAFTGVEGHFTENVLQLVHKTLIVYSVYYMCSCKRT